MARTWGRPSPRRISCGVLVASVGAWIAACSDGSTGPEPGPSAPNRPPAATGTIPAQEVAVGATATVDVASYFTDPDGDRLTYSTESSDVAVATAGVSGSTVSLTGIASGSATVTVMATDPDGPRATQSFGVTVPNRASEPTDVFPDLELAVGAQATVDVSGYFTDPDEDPLTFEAESSQADVGRDRDFGQHHHRHGGGAGTATIRHRDRSRRARGRAELQRDRAQPRAAHHRHDPLR